MSTFERGASPNMSLREKSLVKRRINKEHNSNFRAGYVHINEEQLHKTGIRGRKRCIIYCLTFLLVLIVIANLIMTLLLLWRLNISQKGMRSLEFTPGGTLLRFLQDSDMGDVYPMKSTVGSLPDEPLEVSATNQQQLLFRVLQQNGSKVSVTTDRIQVRAQQGFTVMDADSGAAIFSSIFDSRSQLPEGVDNVKVEQVTTSRVTSAVNERLRVEAGSALLLAGSEGVHISGKQTTISGKTNINISTGNQLLLSSTGGYYFERVRNMPKKDGDTASPTVGQVTSYKVCVCMPAGKVFAVPSVASCEFGHETENPCLG